MPIITKNISKLKRLWCLTVVLFPIVISAQTKFLNKKINLKADSITVDLALDKLAKECKCYFTYNAELVKGNGIVSLNIKNTSLKVVLDSLLKTDNLVFSEYKNQVVISNTNKLLIQQQLEFDTSQIIIRAKVIDKYTLKPLPFASVALQGSYLGTICNEKGNFTLRLESGLLTDSLLISYMGYYTTKRAVSTIRDEARIKLEPGIVSIQEVIVRNADPKYILKNAIHQISKNYESNPFNYKAFYREAIKTDNNYSLYTEAALQGYRPKLQNTVYTDKVQVIKSRKFSKINNTDTVAVKLSSGLASCLDLDIVDKLPDFLSDKRDELYNFTLNDILVWEESLVYSIEFKQRTNITESLPEGYLYISMTDYAIIGCEFSFSKERMQKNSFVVRKTRSVRVKPMGSEYYIRYKKIKDKYFLSHVRGELFMNVKKKRKLFSKDYAMLIEMVVTNIDINTIKPELKKKQFVKTNSIFSESEFIFEKNYWGTNNSIVPETDILKAINNMGLKVYVSDNL